MLAADSEDIAESYRILIDELEQYNPELLDKKRVIAVSKSDLIDKKEQNKIAKKLPKDIPHIFISAITNYQIDALKDLLWQSLQAENTLPLQD